MNRAQENNSTIATAVEIWKDLLEAFPQKFKSSYALLKERSRLFLEDPVCLAANLLQPQLNGRRLTPEETQKACSFVAEFAPEAQDAILKYMAKESPYESRLFF